MMRAFTAGAVVTAATLMAAPGQAKTRFAKAGTFVVGGSIEFSDGDSTMEIGDKKDEESETEVEAGPKLGYFLLDGLLLAAGPVIMYAKTEKDEIDEDPIDITATEFGGVMEADYFAGLTDSVFVFGGVMIGFGNGTLEVQSEGTTIEGDLSVISYGARGGTVFVFGDDAGGFISLSAGVIKTTGEVDFEVIGDADFESTDFRLGTGIGAFF